MTTTNRLINPSPPNLPLGTDQYERAVIKISLPIFCVCTLTNYKMRLQRLQAMQVVDIWRFHTERSQAIKTKQRQPTQLR